MRRAGTAAVRFACGALWPALFIPATLTPATAQETDHRVGAYRVTDSWEYGYRSAFVSGDRDMYRSSVNYNNGLRLFDGMLKINSGDGHGRWLDELTLTTFGAGGDPYQASSLRLEKNRWFRFDMGFRIINYHNSLLSLSGGEHRFNTEHILENYDVTFLPQRRVQLLVGYDRSNQNGPAVTSENFNVLREAAFPRDQFFVFADSVRQVSNQWRAGANATVAGMKLSFLQGWNTYKQDPVNSTSGVQPLAPGGTVAESFLRSDPVHGGTPWTRFNLHTDANRRFALNGRFVYVWGERAYALDENISSANPISSALVTRQDYVLGTGKRTQGTGDLTVSFQPGERWALSNTTSFNQTRISGDSAFVEARQPVSPFDPGLNTYFFDIFGIRLITNATDINFRATKKIGFYGGYHYSIRRTEDREIQQDISGAPTGVPLYKVDNVLHSGLAGVRVRLNANFSALADSEYGTASLPFTPISEKNYHAETLKAQWKRKAWLATASLKNYHNRNIAPSALDGLVGDSSFSSNYESRQYSTSLSWAPPKRYGFDLTYAKLHLNTLSSIFAFSVPGVPDVAARHSIYISNMHFGQATFRAELMKSTTLFLGYSIVKDTADGGSIATSLPAFVLSYPNFRFNGTDLIDAYPLTYQSPQAKLTVMLHKQLSWNLGWQYYGYSEHYTGLQNYHAHVSYTSLRWGF